MALYFVSVWHAPFYYIRLPGLRASIDSIWPPSSDSTLMFQKRVHFKPRWSRTSLLVHMICKFINKTETGLPLYAIISLQNKPRIHSFAILQFFIAESCFLSYILLLAGIIKSVQTRFLFFSFSVSRHDNVRVLR